MQALSVGSGTWRGRATEAWREQRDGEWRERSEENQKEEELFLNRGRRNPKREKKSGVKRDAESGGRWRTGRLAQRRGK